MIVQLITHRDEVYGLNDDGTVWRMTTRPTEVEAGQEPGQQLYWAKVEVDATGLDAGKRLAAKRKALKK